MQMIDWEIQLRGMRERGLEDRSRLAIYLYHFIHANDTREGIPNFGTTVY